MGFAAPRFEAKRLNLWGTKIMIKDSRRIGQLCTCGVAVFALCIGLYSPKAYSISVILSDAPTNDLELTLGAINSATKTLLVNAYELNSPEIAAAIQGRIEAGVKVRILEEGQPAGGYSDGSKAARDQLVSAMTGSDAAQGDQYSVMTKQARSNRRFHYDHAKYMIVDGKYLLIGSENYSGTGNPRAGSKGNRGWEVYVADSATAKSFQQIFQNDSDPKYGDIDELISRSSQPRLFVDFLKTDLSDLDWSKSAKSKAADDHILTSNTVEADSLEIITSPDNSRDGLVKLLAGAKKSIDLELMTFTASWGVTGKSSPMYDALLETARRGVQVRALLNDEGTFDHLGFNIKKHKNDQMLSLVSKIAKDENLKIEVRIADVSAMKVTYIHNKGALVDGEKVLISSINWDQNSVENNREAALILNSTDAYQYYGPLFEKDWENSGGRRQ